MKVAFSLLELILCIIILGLIFTSISKLFYQLNDNHDYLNYFERLYTLQDKLYTDPHQRDIKLHIQNLKTFDLKENSANDNIFQFKKLH
ncbi:hypothetical protein LCI70_001333, partial [Campylobacter coli]|nr:hypothetical protein [Campylobacter coli]